MLMLKKHANVKKTYICRYRVNHHLIVYSNSLKSNHLFGTKHSTTTTTTATTTTKGLQKITEHKINEQNAKYSN